MENSCIDELKLDTFHRKQRRKVVAKKYPTKYEMPNYMKYAKGIQ